MLHQRAVDGSLDFLSLQLLGNGIVKVNDINVTFPLHVRSQYSCKSVSQKQNHSRLSVSRWQLYKQALVFVVQYLG